VSSKICRQVSHRASGEKSKGEREEEETRERGRGGLASDN